ncbi:universal stress protein, partial [Streptomyces sp. S6]
MNDIVVGVDGSEESLAALRWAAGQARLLNARVVAVHAWEPAGHRLAPYASVAA